MARWLTERTAHFKALANQVAESCRKRTQKIVDEMASSTPAARIAAAKARARATYTKIDEINAQADLKTAQNQTSVVSAVLDAVRIDDLDELFKIRDQLPDWLHERIKNVYAKVNWVKNNGKKGPFTVAVHDNHIPVDKALTILAHLHSFPGGEALDGCVDAVIECGLFPKVKKGVFKKGKKVGEEHMFHYSQRCQDGEHCNLCNYINISDGLKILLESYDESAFYHGGSWFAFSVAPRSDPAKAKAIGRTLVPEDWIYENPNSIVFRESYQGRAFKYGDVVDVDEDQDWHVESAIRRFLGAVQCALGKLIKNGWLDGIRAKIENSIEFLPFASHQHWHAVGSSKCEHDPRKMAEFIKAEADEILAHSCLGLYADVMVAVIAESADLERWVRYINKPVDLVGPIDSVYNRFPGLRRSDEKFKEMYEELCLYLVRSRRVFGMIRHPPSEDDERGAHTYQLYRRYVRGNHKFGVGSILSEPPRHRKWRKRHADNEAESRRRDRMQCLAHRLGFRVVKCPRHNPEAQGFGTYHVVDSHSNQIVAAGELGQYGLSLKQCGNFLKKKQMAVKPPD
jgi:hypothetical protein